MDKTNNLFNIYVIHDYIMDEIKRNYLDDILSIPNCTILVLLIHEITHYCVFRIFKIQVIKLKICVYLINFTYEKPQISISEDKFFGGYCSFIMPVKEKIRYAIIGLASGGMSGIVSGMMIFVGYISGFIKWQYSPFCSCFMIAGIYSFYITLIRKNSADRAAIEKLMSLMKENI